MGWDGIQNDGRRHSAMEHIERGVGPITAARTLKAVRKGDVIYGAVRDDEDGVFGMVLAMQRARGWTYYKVMDESMGPFESEAPAEVLDLLTDTEHEYALAWRARCRDALA